MKPSELVQVEEVWIPVKKGGDAINKDGTHMKLIAMFVGGQCVRLDDGFYAEIRKITLDEATRILEANQKDK